MWHGNRDIPLVSDKCPRTSRLPVIYVFGKKTLDVEQAVTGLLNLLPSDSQNILLESDVMYSHSMGTFLVSAVKQLLTTNLQVTFSSRHEKNFALAKAQQQ